MHVHKTVFHHRVTFSDCDPAHMAYYPRILEWFDHSTDHLFRSVGLKWEKMFKAGKPAGMPLLDISVQFKSPCRFGDELAITTWIDAFEGRRFTVKHELQNGDVLGATCREHRAWVMIDPASAKGIKAVPVPDEIRRLFHRSA
jgi:4-hydroxybenzoyl-CoA thioesterase